MGVSWGWEWEVRCWCGMNGGDTHSLLFGHQPRVHRVNVKFSNIHVKMCFSICSCTHQGQEHC